MNDRSLEALIIALMATFSVYCIALAAVGILSVFSPLARPVPAPIQMRCFQPGTLDVEGFVMCPDQQMNEGVRT